MPLVFAQTGEPQIIRKIGETVTVVKLHGEGAVKRRIMDMGITKGTTVYVRKVAPLGDPIEVTVRNYGLHSYDGLGRSAWLTGYA